MFILQDMKLRINQLWFKNKDFMCINMLKIIINNDYDKNMWLCKIIIYLLCKYVKNIYNIK